MKVTVEVCRLSDGKASVRLDGSEVAILPRRQDCGLDEVQDVMQKLVDAFSGTEEW